MMEKYKGMPKQPGKYRCIFFNPETHEFDDKRDLWIFPGERVKPWNDTPVGLDYTALPGTAYNDWGGKPITNDDGVIRLMAAIIDRAKKDMFGASKNNRYTAEWFLDTRLGREWYRRETAYRQTADYTATLEKRKKAIIRTLEWQKRKKEKEREQNNGKNV